MATQAPPIQNRTPKKTERPTFRSTGIKRKTLALLAEYACLRTKDVASLLRGREPNENDLRTARRTLQLLWKEKLVNRLPYFELDREFGGATYVYGLSDKGLNFLCDDASLPLYHLYKSFDEHSARTLDHELEISFFHMKIKELCEKQGTKPYWQQTDLKTASIHPDALFAITDPKKPEGKNTLYYFLEIERSKLGHFRDGEPSILKKLGKYYDHYNTQACQKDWNFKQFRVIVVQRTETRMGNLLAALSGKYNHRMFWLTSETLYKEKIGAEIFKTPKDFTDTTYSLVP
jgi:hypothetical protein